MPNVLKPSTVVRNVTTQTVAGEVTVNLNIVLTLQGGELSVSTQAQPQDKEIPDFVKQLPDWGVIEDEDLIVFGQEVKE